jgi:DNA-directed RNA polymerase subunit alpha
MEQDHQEKYTKEYTKGRKKLIMEKFIKLNYSEVKAKKVSNFESEFVIEPLERGFSNTIGNAIRRTLLSSVSSVAPFAIKISGADHEFQTIKNVSEDVVQLVLNIKSLKFHYSPEIFADDEIVRVYVKAKKGEVKASQIELPNGVTLVNENHYIGTAATDGALEFELYLTSGRGFVSFNKNKLFIKKNQNKLETKIKTGQVIAIDSDFSPVKKVAYETKELNSSAPIIQESLTLKITTDGSIDAKDALAQAAFILSAHLDIIKNVANLDKEDIFKEAMKKDEQSKSLSLSLSALDLSVRSYNSLKRAGFNKISELSTLSLSELESIKNLGKKSVKEIIAKLEEHQIFISDGSVNG